MTTEDSAETTRWRRYGFSCVVGPAHPVAVEYGQPGWVWTVAGPGGGDTGGAASRLAAVRAANAYAVTRGRIGRREYDSPRTG